MSADDENRFRPKPGRIRADTPKVGKTRSFLTQAKKLARQHSTANPKYAPRLESRTTAKGGKGSRSVKGPGVQRGRGARFVRARTLSGGWRHSAPGMRRVVVKTRYVKDAGRNGRSAAHLRYIQRDGTSRDGERGQLYSATEDRADGDAFVERGKEDRHQFRFIISPEDGADLLDLTAHTRDLMSQIEADLGTKLDWVAVNHHNTGHPHVHVIVRGKDDLGENLVINGDYLANGIRERASELTTLELGQVTEIEQSRKLSAEIDQDCFTRIDRAMAEEADERFLDLRHEPAEPRRQFNRALRLRRLAKLEKMGLATPHAPGVWELSKDMEPTLREMGERGDIIRLILNQIGRRLTEELTTSGKRHRLLLMLDEFPALGRLDFFESALAFMAGYGIKGFLIAQSLNQIERAYGPNNAILDNCHARVSFATNDERTAKRVSDALGTATELRDSTNYAGHRLAPWLGHLMVSRQETARPLLTPGEIMQLPPTDEIVMVAGTPPIRATKARYFEDARFQERILTPPDLVAAPLVPSPSADDWSGRVVGAENHAATDAADGTEGDPANAGIRREPELPEHEEIVAPPPSPEQEFEFLDDEPDVDAAKARTIRQRMRMVARQVAMNPDDGIEL
jgi:type IV secretory pathway VirD2 relaxase